MLSSYLHQAQHYYHSLPNGQKHFQDFEFNISEFLLNKLKDGEPHITTEHILEAKAFHGPFSEAPEFNGGGKVNKAEKKNADVYQPGKSISPDENLQKVVLAVLSILGLSF